MSALCGVYGLPSTRAPLPNEYSLTEPAGVDTVPPTWIVVFVVVHQPKK